MSLAADVSSEARVLFAGARGRSLAVIAGAWAVVLGTRMVYPVLLPSLRDAFGLSLTAAGALVTVLWLGSALGQFPGGVLADRRSERLVLAVSPVVTAAGVLAVLLAPTALALFAATAVLGLGISLYPIARITALSDLFPDRLGSALGVTMASGDVGQMVLPPVAGVAAAAVAWHLGLGLVVPLLLVAAVGLWVAVPGPGALGPVDTEAGADVPSIWETLSTIRWSEIGPVAVLLLLYVGVWQSFTGFYPTYLVDVKGLSPAAAGATFSVFFAAGAVVKTVSGAAYDRVGPRLTLVAMFVGPVVALVAVPFVTGFWPLVAVTALVSTMLGSGTVTQSYLADVFPREARGTGLGAVRTTVSTLGATGPLLFGVVADRGYFDEAYLVLAAVLILVSLLALRLPGQPGATAAGG